MIKPLLKKLYKFCLILIVSVIILECIGYLAYTYGFNLADFDTFMSNHVTESLLLQLLVITILIFSWTYIVQTWLQSKLKNQAIDSSTQEFINLISSKKFALCFFGILFLVVNII